MTTERRYYVDGDKQMTVEPDGTIHESDPDEPELLALKERMREWMESDARDATPQPTDEARLPLTAEGLNVIEAAFTFVRARGVARTYAEHALRQALFHYNAALKGTSDDR